MADRTGQKRRGRPRIGDDGLTREHVFKEGLALLADQGLSALTMRRTADRLGVSAMALYNHVPNKAGLLQGVAEALMDQATFIGDEVAWNDRIVSCFRELRRVCRTHPEAVRLLETMQSPPARVFRPIEITLGALQEIGLGGDDALRAFYLLTNFTLGQASYEARGPFEGLDPKRRISAGDSVPVATSAETDWDFDRAFEFGLATIMTGLAPGYDGRPTDGNDRIRSA